MIRRLALLERELGNVKPTSLSPTILSLSKGWLCFKRLRAKTRRKVQCFDKLGRDGFGSDLATVGMGRFAHSTAASASVEFALMVPMLVVLMFGGSEAGHFVWTQHKLVEAVRDGARYASRLPVVGFDGVCDGATETISTDQIDRIKLVTRTGQLANAAAKPVVPGWTDAQVTVTVTCQAFVATGIYTDLGEAGPVVTVSTSGVSYPSLFNSLAGLGGGINLSARSNAAVIGI